MDTFSISPVLVTQEVVLLDSPDGCGIVITFLSFSVVRVHPSSSTSSRSMAPSSKLLDLRVKVAVQQRASGKHMADLHVTLTNPFH